MTCGLLCKPQKMLPGFRPDNTLQPAGETMRSAIPLRNQRFAPQRGVIISVIAYRSSQIAHLRYSVAKHVAEMGWSGAAPRVSRMRRSRPDFWATPESMNRKSSRLGVGTAL